MHFSEQYVAIREGNWPQGPAQIIEVRWETAACCGFLVLCSIIFIERRDLEWSSIARSYTIALYKGKDVLEKWWPERETRSFRLTAVFRRDIVASGMAECDYMLM